MPGGCKIHRAYLKRRKEKGIKDVDFLLAAMDKHFKRDVLPVISIDQIKDYQFWSNVTKLKALSFLKKWNWSRLEEVKKLIIRKKKELDNQPTTI